MNRAAKYLRFLEIANPGKLTRIWQVRSLRDGDLIGEIRWYGGWRRYVCCHMPNTFSEADGLRFIADFCEEQTRKHLSRA
jgi:hypothetical protein